MDSAIEVVRIFQDCDVFERLLREDNRSTNEVGFILTASGTHKQFKIGERSQIDFYGIGTGREPEAVVHTHPTIDSGPTFSPRDLEMRTVNRGVQAMIILSREMFETRWDGVCAYFGPSTSDDAEYEELRFEVICDGSTEGPSEERWIENPRIRFKP